MSDDSGHPRLSSEDFAAIAGILREAAGIKLGPTKQELVFGRLSRRLRTLGLSSFAQYRAILDGPGGDAERGEMVNALTTNLTGFFREPHHFTYLADIVLPALLQSGARRLRLWSAACSSGEEPYSMAMVLHRAMARRGPCDARILATDIDTNMIGAARLGRYDADRAAAIPAVFADLYALDADGTAQMSAAIRQRITFNPLNLLGPWPMKGRFDVVFCRNVVIYFERHVQRVLFDRIADILNPGGTLCIGHSESLFHVSDRFESLGRTIYRKLR